MGMREMRGGGGGGAALYHVGSYALLLGASGHCCYSSYNLCKSK